MKRRSFLGSILALGAAPAIVRAENLMPVASKIITPDDDWFWSSENFQKVPYPTSFGLSTRGKSIITGQYAKELWPGVNKFWHEYYDNLAITHYNSIFKE